MFDVKMLIYVIFSMLILYVVVELSLYRIHSKLTKIEKRLIAMTRQVNNSNDPTNIQDKQNSKKDNLR